MHWVKNELLKTCKGAVCKKRKLKKKIKKEKRHPTPHPSPLR